MDDPALFLFANGPFAGQSSSFLKAVVAHMEILQVKAGDTLTEQGEPVKWIYLILSGRFGFRPAADRVTSRVTELIAGQCFGELSLPSGTPRSSEVCALEDSQVARLSDHSLNALLASYPDETKQVTRRILESS